MGFTQLFSKWPESFIRPLGRCLHSLWHQGSYQPNGSLLYLDYFWYPNGQSVLQADLYMLIQWALLWGLSVSISQCAHITLGRVYAAVSHSMC